MKKFSLRFRFAMLLCAVFGMALASCSKETPQSSVTMPQQQHIKCNAGERPTLSFSVEGNWQLSSDTVWCKFIGQSGDVLDISGTAGTHTITLRITDDNIADTSTVANLTMKLGGQTQIIAIVERGALQPQLSIFDENGKQLETIPVGFDSYATFCVEANFRFATKEYPQWVELLGDAISGAAGERVEAKARIIPNGDIERYPITKEDGYTITFINEKGDVSFTFPVVYGGMGEDNISLVGPTGKSFGWEVSLDGKSFRQKNDADGTYVEFHDTLSFSIAAHNDDYEIIYIEQVVDRGLPSHEMNVDWINFDKERMTLSVDATTTSRYGSVMALPRGVYNDICNDIKGNIYEMDYTTGINLETLKYEYLKYVLMEFTQMDFTERGAYEGMYVYHSLTTYEIPCTTLDDAELMAEYGVTEAFTCPFPIAVEDKHPSIIIDPRIEGWDTTSVTEGAASVEFYYKGERLKQSKGEFELGENKNESMAAQLIGPADGFDSEVYALFKVGGTAKKLLVVTPPTI